MKNILLLHGWGYESYSKNFKNDVWSKRDKFVKKLAEIFNVYTINFPGFGPCPEPKEKSWNLEDFAYFVNDFIEKLNIKIDYILGYSFGGAVAVKYKEIINPDIKLILIAPAIIRTYDKSKKFAKTPKFMKPLRNVIRDFYVIKIVKTPEMVYGTKFLRKTYQNIVRVNLLEVLMGFNEKEVNIIYGDKDEMVSPQEAIKSLTPKYKRQIHIVKNGMHDIANTHTLKVISIIKKIS